MCIRDRLAWSARRPSLPHPRLYIGFVGRPTGDPAAGAPRRPTIPSQPLVPHAAEFAPGPPRHRKPRRRIPELVARTAGLCT
eukprot:9679943-Prorocentrum_lima.AAC.1